MASGELFFSSTTAVNELEMSFMDLWRMDFLNFDEVLT